MIDIGNKLDALRAVPGTSKEEDLRTVAQTDSTSDLDSRKIIRDFNRPMETDTPGEASTTTKPRLTQSPSGLNTQEPVIGKKKSLKRPYQCLEIECPKVTVTPNLQAIRTEQILTESPNSVNSTEPVSEHISLFEGPLQHLEEGGNTICRINHECMAFYLRCPNLLNVIHLCEDVLSGKVKALFLPLQDYLRTQPDCNNVSVVVDISGNDFTKCIMPCLIKLNRQLDSRIQQLEYPYTQHNTASTAAGNTDMKTAISMLKDLIDHHPSVNCETPSELRLTVDIIGVEDSHTLTRHLVDAANELQRHKKNAKYRETLQPTDRHEKYGIETALSIFKELKGQIPFIDETSELRLKVQVIGVKDGHSLTRQIFDAAIELHSTEEIKTSNSQELRQYLQHVFQYLKKGGYALSIRETDCSAFYICCPTLAYAMTLCEDFLTGKVEALFQPLQGYLKTLPECQDVSIVVDISENDFVNCIFPSLTAIKRHLDSCVPTQGLDSMGSVAVSKYADKGIESCTSNKQDSSFEGPFSVHPWDRLISQLCEEFSVEDSDFENFLWGSKTRIGDDNYNRIQSLDGRSGQKYHAFFDCLERKFGQHDSVEFLLHLTATLNFHSDSACVTYTTAFEQYKQDIEELHLTTKGLVMEPSCKIVDILQKRPEENVSSYERHPKGVVLWGQLGMGMTRFLNQILWRLRFGSLTTSIVRQWNIVAVNQRDKTEVKELSSNMINNIRKEMGMEDIICDFISVNDQKQNLMSLLKDLGKRKGDYLVILDDMDGHFKHEHSPCEQFLTDVMDTIAEVDNIKIILTVSKSVSKSNVIDSFGGKLVFGGHMLEFNLTEEILTENIPTKEILMPKISCLEDQLQNDRLSLDDLGKLLKEANQTLTHAKEAGERFSEEAERTLKEGLKECSLVGMAADTNIFKDKNTNNWFKACISLNFTKEGLTDFLLTELHNVQTLVGRSCGQCFIQNLIPCPTQGVCTKRKRNNCSFHNSLQPTQCQTCQKVKQNITLLHRFNGPSWANTKAERWAMDPWEIGKCYLPRDGYSSVSSVQESDFNGVVSIVLNCTHFQTCISAACLSPPPPDKQCPLEKVRQIGRDVRHTADCKVTDADLQDFFLTLTTLLADPVHLLHDPSATNARRKLGDLKNDRLSFVDLGKMLKEANQTLTHAKEAGERFSEEAERTLKEGLNTLEAKIQAGKERLENKTQTSEHRIEKKAHSGEQRLENKTQAGEQRIEKKTQCGEQSIENKTQAGEQSIENKTQESINRINQAAIGKELDEYERDVTDLLKRLVNHYRDTVCYVPLSTLDPSLNKHVQDVYATPKIHRMKIENDGRRTQQEEILTYKDCFYRGDHLCRRTYLQGEPGSGKTSFAAKLVDDWCNVHESSNESTKEQTAFVDVDTLHNFKFLFFISLRDSKEQTHVTHMIQTQLIYKIYAADEWDSK
ncbi:uncharacterized protein LOC127852782 isoform X3 [Dreissena polymorpha]|uniref:uncharacterized protein LOC127852782 isoform X3 n=1 Tax=Dreissena polymorpha TaxID=45954 RepID=UPI002264EDBF|nr:uncharacterized protein LOC127852782 isoform X3 [Dreissena polymorpha]